MANISGFNVLQFGSLEDLEEIGYSLLDFDKRIMRVLIIVLGLICAAYAGPRQSRIVGGELTSIDKYPFTAAMLSRSWLGGFFQSCGGTLITTTAVASAGHCFSGLPDATRVRLGSTYASSGGTVHLVSRITRHPQYVAAVLLNDVAVVRLSIPAVLSNQIKLARVAGPTYVLPTNTVVNTIGWGDTEFDGEPSEILQHVAVNIIDHKICTERYAYLKTLPNMSRWPDVTAEMICTGILDKGGKDGCQGDSGGPVIHGGDVLVGITSWGFECAHHFYPGVNVRVSSYTDWISTNSVN